MAEDLKQDYTDPKTGLTEKEQYFLDILFDVHKGNIRLAMQDAGFPKGMPTRLLTEKLKDKITEMAKTYLALNTGRAAAELISVFDDPNAPGTKNVIAAAKEVLDRTGIKSKDEAPVVEKNIFILPPKGGRMPEDVE